MNARTRRGQERTKRLLALLAVFLIAPTPRAAPQTSTTREIVTAADAFLASLSAAQRQQVSYAFDDAVQRARWSNFPTGFVPRGGISLAQMTPAQRDAAMHLLAMVLSPQGLDKVNEIREADDDFKANGSRRGPPGRGGPPPPGAPPAYRNGPPPQLQNAGGSPPSGGAIFGSDLYFFSFLGSPSVSTPWMLQFGGHHLALNITIAGSHGILTPTLTGAQPAVFTLQGKTIRPLGRESDQALALLQSLDATQRRQAILGYSVPDLVLGPGEDGKKIAPEGIPASALNAAQQARLLDLIGAWAGIVNLGAANERMAEIKTDLNATYFAWSGDTAGQIGRNITAYYRIQGPHLVIEYAPQHDEPTNHVHTIYRDPTNDYGSAVIEP